MARKPLYDVSTIDQNNIQISKQEIEQVNPHRHEFMLLDGIFLCRPEERIIVGYRDVHDDEFWVRGHIPGRPLMPGVLLIETAAQLVSYYAQSVLPQAGFLGFARVDKVKFRGSVVPGDRLMMAGYLIDLRPRRCIADTQAYVDGKVVYEGRITGMWM